MEGAEGGGVAMVDSLLSLSHSLSVKVDGAHGLLIHALVLSSDPIVAALPLAKSSRSHGPSTYLFIYLF